MTEQEKREKVIKGLECCLEIRNICWDNPKCPYNDCEDRVCGDGCMSFMMRDALALLKAREPMVPTMGCTVGYEGQDSWWYQCGKCETPIDVDDKYCRNCGQAVKWDG